MSSGPSPSSPAGSDAIALILEINQLLLQHALQLQEKSGTSPESPIVADPVRNECFQRLSSNLSFLACCADPRNKARPTMPNLIAPKSVPSVQEHYVRLATLFPRHLSPKQVLKSPAYVANTPVQLHTLAQAKPSQSPKKRVMSPPSAPPAAAYQQSQQQTLLQQQQRLNIQPQVNVNGGMYIGPQSNPAHLPQQVNPYMLEQMRMQEKMPSYPNQQNIKMTASPSPHQQHQQIPRAYTPVTAQQMAMAQGRTMPQAYQQHYQAPYYSTNSGQGYLG